MNEEITRDDEQFYDDEIAPVLLELATKCKERGVPFKAIVWYTDQDCGDTRAVWDEAKHHWPKASTFAAFTITGGKK